nr:S8 family serine peptidase [Lachnospiraceae bacterium]
MRKGYKRILTGLLTGVMLISQSSVAFASESSNNADMFSQSETVSEVMKEMDGSLEAYGFPGGYEIDEQDLKFKEELRDHDVVGTLEECSEGEDYVGGMIWYAADSREEADAIASAYGAVVTRYAYGIADAELTGDRTVLDAVRAAADTGVSLPVVEPVMIAQIDPISETELEEESLDEVGFALDPALGWKDFVTGTGEYAPILDNPDPLLMTPGGDDYQYHHDIINSWGAWGTTIGNPDVKVGVIDTGVFDKHEDFYDANGKNCVVKRVDTTGNDVFASHLHGTLVASLIAATINNGKGGAGIAPGVSIYSYNVAASSSGSMRASDITRGVLAAVEDGVDIINMSLGAPTYSVYERNALSQAYQSGIVTFAAMGNDGINNMVFPAAYSIETGDLKTGVMAVGSVTQNGQRSDFSNYGSWCVVSAPGTNIRSATVNFDNSNPISSEEGYGPFYPVIESDTSNYTTASGTSVASPVAAGAAALYMSAYGKKLGGSNKELTGYKIPDTIKSIMTGTGTSVSGAGKLINVGKMFANVVKAPEIVACYENGTVIQGENGKKVYREASFAVIESQSALSANLLPGAAGRYEGEVIIYTTDGTDPKVDKSGPYVVRGKRYHTGDIISTGDLKPGTKTVIKALSVNPQKEVSAISTATVYTPVSNPAKVLISPVKKITLSANSTGSLAKNPGRTSVLYLTGSETEEEDIITPEITFDGIPDEDIVDKMYWATSNSKVATAVKNSDGTCSVYPVGKGSCNVTLYIYSAGKVKKHKSINVTVKQLVSDISIKGQSVVEPSAKKNVTAAFKATCTPENANSKK